MPGVPSTDSSPIHQPHTSNELAVMAVQDRFNLFVNGGGNSATLVLDPEFMELVESAPQEHPLIQRYARMIAEAKKLTSEGVTE